MRPHHAQDEDGAEDARGQPHGEHVDLEAALAPLELRLWLGSGLGLGLGLGLGFALTLTLQSKSGCAVQRTAHGVSRAPRNAQRDAQRDAQRNAP